MKHLKAYSDFIKFLCSKTTSAKQRKALLSTSSTEQMNIICEIFANALAGALSLTKSEIPKLQQHAQIMRRLAKRDIKDSHRHALLVRHSHVVAEILAVLLKYLAL